MASSPGRDDTIENDKSNKGKKSDQTSAGTAVPPAAKVLFRIGGLDMTMSQSLAIGLIATASISLLLNAIMNKYVVHKQTKAAYAGENKPGLLVRVLGGKFFLFLCIVGFFSAVPFILKAFRREIDCPGCLAPGVFYSCKKGTGPNSTACQEYRDFRKKFDTLFDDLDKATEAAKQLGRYTSATVYELQEMLAKLAVEFGKIKVPSVSPPSVGSVPEFGCTIPVIKYNLCKDLRNAINSKVMGPLRSSVEKASDSINKASKGVTDMATKPIKAIVDELSELADYVSGQIKEMKKEVDRILDVYDTIEEIIETTSIVKLFTAYLTDQINALFGGDNGYWILTFIIFALIMAFISFSMNFIGGVMTIVAMFSSGPKIENPKEPASASETKE